MATSELSICNDALIRLGCTTIASLSDDSKEADLCNEQYEKCRDQLLSAHPWNFAIARIEIAADADLPTGWEDNPEWDLSFTLPANCLRVLELDDSEAEWAVENGSLFANYDPVFIKYIKKETDTTLYSKHFEKALAYELAMSLVYSFTQSATFVAELRKDYEQAVREARSFDAQEGSVKTVQADDWLLSRR